MTADAVAAVPVLWWSPTLAVGDGVDWEPGIAPGVIAEHDPDAPLAFLPETVLGLLGQAAPAVPAVPATPSDSKSGRRRPDAAVPDTELRAAVGHLLAEITDLESLGLTVPPSLNARINYVRAALDAAVRAARTRTEN